MYVQFSQYLANGETYLPCEYEYKSERGFTNRSIPVTYALFRYIWCGSEKKMNAAVWGAILGALDSEKNQRISE